MTGRTSAVKATPLLLLLALAAFPALAQEAPSIAGSLSNFDVRVAGARAVDGFQLELAGRIEPDCIRGWYPGWGAPPAIKPGTSQGPGITVSWQSADDPLRLGRSEHFGLSMECEGEIAARGFWTRDGRRVAEVPLPWQTWETRPEVVWDVIRMAADVDIDKVAVLRESVTLPRRIPLEKLNWDAVEEIVREMRRQWTPADRRPLPLTRGERTVLKVPVQADDQAVLVRYVVSVDGEIASRFLNQAILIWPGGLCPPGLPDPQVDVTGSEDYTGGDGNPYTRYNVEVTNRAAYPNALFAPSPSLPPCGLNTSSSRTWVDLHDGDGVRLFGFCALGSADSLADLWFAVPRGQPPADCVRVTLNDRLCNRTYESECASTGGFGPPCIDFETPPPGTVYHAGDVFADSGATIGVRPFQWGNGTWFAGGHAQVSNLGQAGHVGQEVIVNNVNLSFGFPVLPNAVHLHFGEYGGNLNLEINGDFRNFADFADADGTVLGGVAVAVTNGFGNDQGTVLLTGDVHSLAIGGQELVLDHVCFTEAPGVDATGVWVLPYGVGGTRLDQIKPTGLVDYTDGGSGFHMVDAPFGGHLGFRLGSANVIPTPGIYYYRFQYKAEAAATWTDFDETVRVHYVRESPGSLAFPTLALGPHDVGGKNLYRFRPHEAELPSLVPVAPGETVGWPSTGFLGDIYSGFLNTVNKSLPPGRYHVRVGIYNSSGTQVTPGGGTFEFRVPTGVDAMGTIQTAVAAPDPTGGFVFTLHVDNRSTGAVIDEPTIGAVGAGDCGFLRFDPLDPPLSSASPPVQVAFHATHPDNRAMFGFGIVRGPNPAALASVSGEVAALSAGIAGVFPAYAGDGNGNFSRAFARGELLGACVEAAFSENLHVYAKATTGWGHRIGSLDSHAVRAFALTPQ
jgi:hypothetical protein